MFHLIFNFIQSELLFYFFEITDKSIINKRKRVYKEKKKRNTRGPAELLSVKIEES